MGLPGCVGQHRALLRCWLSLCYDAAAMAPAAAVAQMRSAALLCQMPGCMWSLVRAAHPMMAAAAGPQLRLPLCAVGLVGSHLQYMHKPQNDLSVLVTDCSPGDLW
jgi:hypothetical protein